MTGPAIALIAAVAENGVIGSGGDLPWRVRADMRHFRAETMGKPVIMGRKTFESLSKPLDGRRVIVVTRNKAFNADNVDVAYNLVEAMRLAEIRAREHGADEICVAGGGEIYGEVMPRADRLSISHVMVSPEGDTHFPEIDPEEWQEVARQPLERSQGDTADAVHVQYRRRS
jgi:dihydrofolate reductase